MTTRDLFQSGTKVQVMRSSGASCSNAAREFDKQVGVVCIINTSDGGDDKKTNDQVFVRFDGQCHPISFDLSELRVVEPAPQRRQSEPRGPLRKVHVLDHGHIEVREEMTVAELMSKIKRTQQAKSSGLRDGTWYLTMGSWKSLSEHHTLKHYNVQAGTELNVRRILFGGMRGNRGVSDAKITKASGRPCKTPPAGAFWTSQFTKPELRHFNLQITVQEIKKINKVKTAVSAQLNLQSSEGQEARYKKSGSSYKIEAWDGAEYDENLIIHCETVGSKPQAPVGLVEIWINFLVDGEMKVKLKSKCQGCGMKHRGFSFKYKKTATTTPLSWKEQKVVYPKCCNDNSVIIGLLAMEFTPS